MQYGAHRPHKLPKVAHALVAKARSQANQKAGQPRTAQLSVTLAVLKRLIVDCANDLGLFALDALEIVQIAAACTDGQGHADIDIAERAANAVRLICFGIDLTCAVPQLHHVRSGDDAGTGCGGDAQVR